MDQIQAAVKSVIMLSIMLRFILVSVIAGPFVERCAASANHVNEQAQIAVLESPEADNPKIDNYLKNLACYTVRFGYIAQVATTTNSDHITIYWHLNPERAIDIYGSTGQIIIPEWNAFIGLELGAISYPNKIVPALFEGYQFAFVHSLSRYRGDSFKTWASVSAAKEDLLHCELDSFEIPVTKAQRAEIIKFVNGGAQSPMSKGDRFYCSKIYAFEGCIRVLDLERKRLYKVRSFDLLEPSLNSELPRPSGRVTELGKLKIGEQFINTYGTFSSDLLTAFDLLSCFTDESQY